jgi:hypothetical protein
MGINSMLFLPAGLLFFTFWRPTFIYKKPIGHPALQGLSTESEMNNQLCALCVSSDLSGRSSKSEA